MTYTHVPATLLADQAILLATEEEREETSPWYTDGKYIFRFVRVSQFLFSSAQAHLKSRLRQRRPKPPIIRKSGREMTNKADPLYIEAMELWKQEQEDLGREANLSTAVFRGIELQGPIPPTEEWLPGVLSDFASIGIDEESAYRTFYYDKDRLHELWFKKFVILKSKSVTQKFAEFQGTEEEDEVIDPEEDEDTAFAVDMFQSEPSPDNVT